MVKAHQDWTVLPHGPLTQLSERVWAADGTLKDMPLPRRMVVAQLASGGLVLHNPIALDDEGMGALEALGPVRYILTPNAFHRLDSPSFKARYPAAKLLCPAGSRAKVEEVVMADGSYDDLPDDAHVSLSHLDGVKESEGVMTVADADGATVVLNDAMFNLDHMDGMFGFIYGKLMGNAGKPKVTTISRLFLVKDKKAFRAHLERLAETPDLRRVIVSHGNIIENDAAGVLRRVAADL